MEGYLGQVRRSRVKGQGHQVKKCFFNDMYCDTAATRKQLTEIKPGFLLSAVIISSLQDRSLYVQCNFMYECWGYDMGCFQSICVFFLPIDLLSAKETTLKNVHTPQAYAR